MKTQTKYILLSILTILLLGMPIILFLTLSSNASVDNYFSIIQVIYGLLIPVMIFLLGQRYYKLVIRNRYYHEMFTWFSQVIETIDALLHHSKTKSNAFELKHQLLAKLSALTDIGRTMFSNVESKKSRSNEEKNEIKKGSRPDIIEWLIFIYYIHCNKTITETHKDDTRFLISEFICSFSKISEFKHRLEDIESYTKVINNDAKKSLHDLIYYPKPLRSDSGEKDYTERLQRIVEEFRKHEKEFQYIIEDEIVNM